MISTPMFVFGAPMYYGCTNGYNTVTTTQVYQDNNGRMVRNFFAKDSANCIPNPYFTFFGIRPQNLACYYGSGGGASASSVNKAEIARTPEPELEPVKPTRTEATHRHKSVSNPIQTTKKSEPEVVTSTQTQSLGRSFVQVARSYSDVSEADGTHHKFCINSNCKSEDPYDQEWCTDFVTYVVKEAYHKAGKKAPEGFGNHDVETLKNWAIENGKFVKTANLRNKASYFIKNIKPGDIFIMNEDGASHTGFVTRVDKNTGVIHTIEGNRDDQVKEYKYSPNNPDLSGFIKLNL